MKINEKFRVKAIFVCILVLIASICSITSAGASDLEVQGEEKGSLTIILDNKGVVFPGVEYRLYKFGTIKADGSVELFGVFRNLKISVPDTDTETLRVLSTTLKGFVVSGKIAPDRVAVTDDNGNAVFNDLDKALYLVTGDTVRHENNYVIPTPIIVPVPKIHDVTGQMNLDIVLFDKFTVEPVDEVKKIQVLKVWKGTDVLYQPHDISVELYRGDELYDTVVLNKDNKWQAEWNNLVGPDWIAVEKDIPNGFVVTVEQQITRFVVTNTGPRDEEPSTGILEPTTGEEDSTSEDGSTLPPEDGTTEPSDEVTTKPTGGTPELPNTGQLWWPVLALAFFGVFFIVFGIVSRRYEEVL